MGYALMIAGGVLLMIHVNAVRAGRWQAMNSAAHRAGWRLLWDVTAGAVMVGVVAAFALAPRPGRPGQRR